MLDPEKNLFDYVLSREHCIHYPEKDLFIKDLRILNRDLRNVVIVDNSIASFIFQLSNGWPIVSYRGDPLDKALVELTSFLIGNRDCADFTELLDDKFRLSELVECNIHKI